MYYTVDNSRASAHLERVSLCSEAPDLHGEVHHRPPLLEQQSGVGGTGDGTPQLGQGHPAQGGEVAVVKHTIYKELSNYPP